MPKMRAKLQVSSVENFGDQEEVKMFAVTKSDKYPEDGSDEDNTYARFSPSAELKIRIANPSLLGQFKPGQKFYVDFTEASA